jgi:hypothetical protein
MTNRFTGLLASVTILTGVSGGILKGIDWLLPDSLRNRLKDSAATVWLWLSDQRAGKFTGLLRSQRTQRIFSLFTPVAIIAFTLAVVVQTYLHINLNVEANLELGYTRIYPIEVWVDVAALIISAAFLSWRWHPRLAAWIARPQSLWDYFGRALVSFVTSFGLLCVALIPWYIIQDAGSSLEQRPSGPVVIVAIHTLTAFAVAPFLAEILLLYAILVLSFCWLVLVWLMILAFRVVQFILIRIEKNPKGPVLAVCGILAAIGGVAKALELLGK